MPNLAGITKSQRARSRQSRARHAHLVKPEREIHGGTSVERNGAPPRGSLRLLQVRGDA